MRLIHHVSKNLILNQGCYSCVTVLLRVYNDVVTNIGRGNVLLDLSAAFDTIGPDNIL